MKNNIKSQYCVLLIICIFSMSFFQVDAQNKDENVDEIINVGFYSYSPYYFFNEKGKPDGYYNDLLELISKELNIKFNYIFCDVDQAIKKLESGEVDLLFGINKTGDRLEKFLYTDYYIAVESYAIYTNENIPYGKLSDLEGLKFGYIKNEANFEYIINFLENKNINVDFIEANSYKDISKFLRDGTVNATVSNITNEEISNYRRIFDYSAGPVYITANKENEALIEEINEVLAKSAGSDNSDLKTLHSKYFGDKEQTSIQMSISRFIILCIISVVVYMIYKDNKPKAKLIKKQEMIRNNIKNNNYLLYYQPIVNPKDNKVKGFEALLRMKDKDEILTPYYFIKDIEESDMMFEMSLWVFKKAVEDFNIIKNYKNVENENFYISVNISFKEIENDDFINSIKSVAEKLDIQPNTICLEIVERFAMNNLSKIKSAIKELKECGFIIAIDDFGVEYSNLDILEKLDFNIVKLDKYFIDDIQNSLIRKEIVNFVSNLCKFSNKTVVSEGVETEEQRDIIKAIDNDKFYIQGYLYSKPLDIKDLEKFNVD